MPIITVTSLPKPPVAKDDSTTQSQLRQMDPKRKGCFGCTEALTLRDILQAINSEYVPPTVPQSLEAKKRVEQGGERDTQVRETETARKITTAGKTTPVQNGSAVEKGLEQDVIQTTTTMGTPTIVECGVGGEKRPQQVVNEKKVREGNMEMKAQLNKFLDELHRGIPEAYMTEGGKVWVEVATRYGIQGEREKDYFNKWKCDLIWHLERESKTRILPWWICPGESTMRTFFEVKQMFNEAAEEIKRRQGEQEESRRKANCLEEAEEAVERLEQDQISPQGNRKDEIPVQGDSPQRDIEALKRRADDFNREKSSIIDEDILAGNSTAVEGRQSPFHSKRPRFDTEASGPSNLMETASPAGQDQVQSSLEEIAIRTTREEKVSCRLSGTPHCTVSSAVSQTSMDTNFSMEHTRRPDTPAGPSQGEQMAISDIKKENNDNQEELKPTKRKRDWTDEIAGEENDSPPERPGKIGHRMREEDEKRIKELEEEVTCAWKFVFEYRTKWDKLTKALQHKDLAKVEREFPEIFRE